MLSQEENNLMTHTGPGTPGGKLLRRHWHPVRSRRRTATRWRAAAGQGHERRSGFVSRQRRPARLDRPILLASPRRLELWPRRRWRPALPVSWLAVRPSRPLHRTAVRAAGPTLLRESAPSRLPLPGTRGGYLRLHGTRRAAAVAQLTNRLVAPAGHVLVSKFYHECNFFQANEGNLDPSHVSYLASPSQRAG